MRNFSTLEKYSNKKLFSRVQFSEIICRAIVWIFYMLMGGNLSTAEIM
jgi:hypothetical protein